jgi:predicted aspartyl protease
VSLTLHALAPIAFALAAVAAPLGPAPAQEPAPVSSAAPTVEELVARSKAAEDTDRRPETEREIWSVHQAGLDGSLEMLRRGDDVEIDTTAGPFRTSHGTWHGQRWHQNENGETVLDRPEPSQTERVTAQTVARVREPVDAWELTTTYASGHVARFYYDPKTYYLMRSERTVAGRTIHTTYEDFRTDARGRTRFWRYDGGDDRPDNDFDYRLIRDDDDPEVTETEIAIPHDRRTLVEFPAGVDVVRLPARVENDRIYVRLDFGGRGLDFLLDTGASTMTIDENVARDLHLAAYGRTTQTVAGTFVTGRVVAPSISIGNLAMHDVVLHTAPFVSKESHDTRVVGLLGFDFIDAVALKIDYADGTLDAIRPGSLSAPASATPLDVRLNSGMPVAHAVVGDAGGDDFILDTGAAFSYVVFQRFARAHPESFETPGDGAVLYGSGIGGPMSYRKIPSRRIALGTWSFDDELGVEAVSANALGFDNEDGLIGADILKLFTLYLDYGADRVYLAPNGRATMFEAASAARVPEAQHTAAGVAPSRAAPVPLQVRNRLH